MLEGLIEHYLLRYLGEYVVGVDKQNLSVSTWNGEIHLRNARLKQEAVELLNMPFKLLFGEVGVLKINAPWNLLGSRPVVIEASRLLLLLGPKPVNEWSEEEEKRRVQLHRQKMIDKTDVLCDLRLGMGVGEQSKEGFLSRIFTRISDNVEIHLHDLHIRFEDEAPGGGDKAMPFCVGLHLSSLQAQTASAVWAPSFVNRKSEPGQKLFKLLTLEHLSAYHVHPSWVVASASTDEDLREHFGSDGEPWHRTFELSARLGRVSYILPPVSGKLRLTQSLDIANASTPQFVLNCSLEPIKCIISRASYVGICAIMALVSEYFAFQEVVRSRIEAKCRGWPHRPQIAMATGNGKAWWQYANRCVRLSVLASEPGGQQPMTSLLTLLSRENLCRLKFQDEYTGLVRRLKAGQLAGEEEKRMQLLEESLQLSDLLCWRKLTLEQIHQEATLEKEAAAAMVANSGGRWGLWFSRSGRDNHVLEQQSDGDNHSTDGGTPIARVRRTSYSPTKRTASPRIAVACARSVSWSSRRRRNRSSRELDSLSLSRSFRELEGLCLSRASSGIQKTAESRFALLPSVGTWLQESHALEDSEVDAKDKNLPFIWLPSVGSWCLHLASDMQSERHQGDATANVFVAQTENTSAFEASSAVAEGSSEISSCSDGPKSSNLLSVGIDVLPGFGCSSDDLPPASNGSQVSSAAGLGTEQFSSIITAGVANHFPKQVEAAEPEPDAEAPPAAYPEPEAEAELDTGGEVASFFALDADVTTVSRGFQTLPSVGTWLQVSPDENDSSSSPALTFNQIPRNDHFALMPSVGSWLQPLPPLVADEQEEHNEYSSSKGPNSRAWSIWNIWPFSRSRADSHEPAPSQFPRSSTDVIAGASPSGRGQVVHATPSSGSEKGSQQSPQGVRGWLWSTSASVTPTSQAAESPGKSSADGMIVPHAIEAAPAAAVVSSHEPRRGVFAWLSSGRQEQPPSQLLKPTVVSDGEPQTIVAMTTQSGAESHVQNSSGSAAAAHAAVAVTAASSQEPRRGMFTWLSSGRQEQPTSQPVRPSVGSDGDIETIVSTAPSAPNAAESHAQVSAEPADAHVIDVAPAASSSGPRRSMFTWSSSGHQEQLASQEKDLQVVLDVEANAIEAVEPSAQREVLTGKEGERNKSAESKTWWPSWFSLKHGGISAAGTPAKVLKEDRQEMATRESLGPTVASNDNTMEGSDKSRAQLLAGDAEDSVETAVANSNEPVSEEARQADDVLQSAAESNRPSEGKPRRWNAWFYPGAGTEKGDDAADAVSHKVSAAESDGDSGVIAAVVAAPASAFLPTLREAPFLELCVELPEVVVELQTQDYARTEFVAGNIDLALRQSESQEEITLRVDVADLRMTSILKGRGGRSVMTKLIYRDSESPCTKHSSFAGPREEKFESRDTNARDLQDAEGDATVTSDAAVSIEYVSMDVQGQPWVNLHGRQLAFFYQQELFAEVTNFLANDGSDALVRSHSEEGPGLSTALSNAGSRHAFDRWRRRAKALLYSRGRPQVWLQLDAPTLVLPTRPFPSSRDRWHIVDKVAVLALRPVLLTAKSEEVTKKEAQVEAESLPRSPARRVQAANSPQTLLRADRWTVALGGARLLRFASHEVLQADRRAEWNLVKNFNLETCCMLRRHAKQMGAGRPPRIVHSMELLQPPDCGSSAGGLPELVLALDAQAYDSLIRATRLLLKSPRGSAAATVVEPPRASTTRPERLVTAMSEPDSPGSDHVPAEFLEFGTSAECIEDENDELLSPTRTPKRMRSRFSSTFSIEHQSEIEPPEPDQLIVKLGWRFCLLSIRFHCLPEPLDCVEMRGTDAFLEFSSYSDRTTLDMSMTRLELLRPSLPEDSFDHRLVLAEVPTEADVKDAQVFLKLTMASEATAQETYADGAETLIALGLGRSRVVFSPMPLRELVSFAKSTPESDNVEESDLLDDETPQYRVRVDFPLGVSLAWVDEALNLHFAESNMSRSTIQLDLYNETVFFRGSYTDFDIEDRSSKFRPSILQALPGCSYDLEVTAQTFTTKSTDFKGYHTDVKISMASVLLTYMGQKFMRCWSWVLDAFLPAIMASGRKRGESLNSGGTLGDWSAMEDTRSGKEEEAGSEDGELVWEEQVVEAANSSGSDVDDAVSFVSIPEEADIVEEPDTGVQSDDATCPQEACATASAAAPVISPATPRSTPQASSNCSDEACWELADETDFEMFVEASTVELPDVPAGQANAWSAAARAALAAERLAATVAVRNDPLPTFTRLKVVVDSPIIALPVSIDGASGAVFDGPHVRVEARSIEVSNAPCRDVELGLLDAVFLDMKDVRMVAMTDFHVLSVHDLRVRVDRPLEVRVPALPMRVTWRSPRVPMALTPRHFSLLCCVFNKNLVGEDADVVKPPQVPIKSMTAASASPVWLQMNLNWHQFECSFRDDLEGVHSDYVKHSSAESALYREHSKLVAARVDLKLEKHVAPHLRLDCVFETSQLLRCRGTVLQSTVDDATSLQKPFCCILGGVASAATARCDETSRTGQALYEELHPCVQIAIIFVSEATKQKRIEISSAGPRVLLSFPDFNRLWMFFFAEDPGLELWLAQPTTTSSAGSLEIAVEESICVSDSSLLAEEPLKGSPPCVSEDSLAPVIQSQSQNGEASSHTQVEIVDTDGVAEPNAMETIVSLNLRSATAFLVQDDLDPNSPLLAIHNASFDLQLRTCAGIQYWLHSLQHAGASWCRNLKGLCALERAGTPMPYPARDITGCALFRSFTQPAGISLDVDRRIEEIDVHGNHRRRHSIKFTCPALALRLSDKDYGLCLSCLQGEQERKAKDGGVEADAVTVNNSREVDVESGTLPKHEVVDEFHCQVDLLHLTIVSDFGLGACTPFLDIRCTNLNLMEAQSIFQPIRVERHAQVSVLIWFFNPIAACWEPLIEQNPTSGESAETRGYSFKLSSFQSVPETQDKRDKSDKYAIKSSDVLVLNCSDTCWHFFIAHHRQWLAIFQGENSKASSIGGDLEDDGDSFAPFSVRNSTGGALRIRLPNATGLLNLGSNDTRRLSKLRVDTRGSSDHRPRPSIGILVSHDKGELGPAFGEVRGVPLDRVGQYVFRLTRRASSFPGMETLQDGGFSPSASTAESERIFGFSQPLSARPTKFSNQKAALDDGPDDKSMAYIICRVQVVDFMKMLVVESPVMLSNQLSVPLRISVNGVEWPEDLAPGATAAIPITQCQHGSLQIQSTACDWSNEFDFKWLACWPHRGPFDFECLQRDGSGAFHCCVQRIVDNLPDGDVMALQYTMRLKAPVTLISTLPVPISYQVFLRQHPEKDKPWKDKLAPGCREDICTLALSQKFQVCLMLSLFGEEHWSDAIPVWNTSDSGRPGLQSKQIVRVPCADASRYIQLQVILQSAVGEPPEVAIHTPFWVLNHTRSASLKFQSCTTPPATSRMLWPRDPRFEAAVALKPQTNLQQVPMEFKERGDALPVDCEATHVVISLQGDKTAASDRLLSFSVLESEVSVVAPQVADDQSTPEGFDLGVRWIDRIEACDLPVRVLHVAPLYVVVNASVHTLRVRSKKTSRVLQPHEKAPLHWLLYNERRELEVCIEGANWEKSGKLPVDIVGEYAFQCYQRSPLVFENLRLEVRHVEATNFLIFRQDNPRLTEHRIQNYTREALSFRQCKTDAPPLELEPGRCSPFAWREPKAAYPRQLEISYAVTRGNGAVAARVVFDSSKEVSEPQKLGSGVAQMHQLYYQICMCGPSLVLTVTDGSSTSSNESSHNEPLAWNVGVQPVHLEISLEFAGLGISVVAPVVRKLDIGLASSFGRKSSSTAGASAAKPGEQVSMRGELLYLSFRGLAMDYRRSRRHDEVVVQLQDMQIDNQREDALHAVALRGTGRSRSRPVSEIRTSAMLQLNARRLLDPEIVYLDTFELVVRGGLDMRLDSGFILDIADLGQSLLHESGAPGTAATDGALHSKDPLLRAEEVACEGQKFHFGRLSIQKVRVNLTFSGGSGLRSSTWRPGEIGFWYRLAASVSSVESFSLPLETFRLEHTTMPSTSAIAAVQQHYYGQCMQRLRGILLSFDVLGNPRKAMKHLSQGCIDLCCEPFNGAKFSPEDAMEGIWRGLASCLKNSVFGTCHSLSTVAGAASEGCLVCLGDDPRAGRRRLRQRPQLGVQERLRIGCRSCGRGIWQGAVGSMVEPWQGAQKDGLRGLAGGTCRGLAGLLLKPAVGCCDLTKHASEGISSKAIASEEGSRDRLPRALYGWDRVMRPYLAPHATLKATLLECDRTLGLLALLDHVWDEDNLAVVVAVELELVHVRVPPDRRRGSGKPKVLLRQRLRDITGVKYNSSQRAVVLQLRQSRGATSSDAVDLSASAPPRCHRGGSGGDEDTATTTQLSLQSEDAMRQVVKMVRGLL